MGARVLKQSLSLGRGACSGVFPNAPEGSILAPHSCVASIPVPKFTVTVVRGERHCAVAWLRTVCGENKERRDVMK